MKRIILPIILLFIICVQSQSQNKENPVQLLAGETVVDSTTPLGSKLYLQKFSSNEFVFGQVEENKGDFMITIYSPDQSVIEVFNSTSDGTENFSFNTTIAGNYIVEIENLRSSTQKFVLKPIEKEPAAKNIEGKIDQIMHFYPDDGPGAVVGVTKNGEMIFSKGYGLANLEYGISNVSNTVFYLASVSKQFTAFAAALLIDEGKLALDDPVKKYIPELKYDEKITIRDLIYHTNGLPGVLSLHKIKNSQNNILLTHQEAVDIITSQSVLNNPPGEKFDYSNAGYVLLAMVVERITGKPFDLFMEEKVFKPLNMSSTFVGVDHEKIIKNRADHYWPLSNGGLRKIIAPITMYGATGVYSTAEDLAKWLDNFEQPIIGNKAVIQQMYEVGILKNKEINYAFGLGPLNFNENKLIGHGGDLDSYHTYLAYMPEEDLGVIVLSNWYKATPCDDALKILEHWLPEKKEKPKKIPLGTDISMYEGSYITESGLQFQLYPINGDLYAQFFGEGPVYKLQQVAGKEFLGINRSWCVEYKISFKKEKKDKDIEGEMEMYGKSSFKRISSPSETEYKPGKTELQLFEGEYFNAELNTRFNISSVENKLIASNENHKEIILTPKDKDVFSGNRWYLNSIIFTRSDEGEINAMLVSGFRIKDIPFERK